MYYLVIDINSEKGLVCCSDNYSIAHAALELHKESATLYEFSDIENAMEFIALECSVKLSQEDEDPYTPHSYQLAGDEELTLFAPEEFNELEQFIALFD